RTDWNGASMRKLAVGADYEETVGKMNRFRDSFEGHQPGDPVRGAKIIADLARLEEPPLRLLLGSDAVDTAAKASRERAEEAESWAELSRSADYPIN
ncbi:MAG: short-chain dehydrogenase/reductase, partial [Paenibacillaceae bacterium]|nr:short-chain dehydrogenase/reductase [Paenibacillaceae bacterium]